jgi:MFS family permease
MRDDNHSFNDSTLAIQMHILGMFVPALFTGHLIHRFGAAPVTLSGLLILSVSAAVFYTSSTVVVYAVAIAGVGVGWALAFVGATTILASTFVASEKPKAQGLNELVMLSLLSVFVVSASFSLEGLGWELFVAAQLLLVVLTIISVSLLLRKRAQPEKPPAEPVALEVP